ncbi:MAG: hypothetical protein ACXWC4_16225 [Telluria sp.]
MKTLLGITLAASALLAVQPALAGPISDSGAGAYWGADSHGYGDVIGDGQYDINGATITRTGSVLTVAIATNFAGQAGADAWAATGGIGYGDVFLSGAWTPFGSDAHHAGDNASNGTQWTYAFSLDNRWSNTGGTFKLYQLTGANNAAAISNSNSFMNCQLGAQCFYRDGQAAAVNTASADAHDTGLTGTWTVTSGQELLFSIDAAATDLANFASIALHWGETCQNDVIEGSVNVPVPGTVPLAALGFVLLLGVRRRRA